ncbi:hypothetical protein [Tautonia plasticadhaerens]|uniref:Uncharacterized protein n=1 Tax=Tautonia plasticadhaerens TaxID=2527974 RepID=A0A518H481_9BACT|nr:hypothetical protein [Tautonia plasticadhaerens]QDV35618.1 hypothetical protein ElP_35220 [Tautonia plasticadhaerens]
MLIKHYAEGKFYTIRCPEGTMVVRNPVFRASGAPAPCDGIVVPFEGREVPIPAEPAGLLPLLAESRRCGLALVGEPEADVRLHGASCPACGEGDVNWLRAGDDSEMVHCDRCGADFAMPSPALIPIPDPKRQ